MKKIILFLILSQIFILGVFWNSHVSYFVLEENLNLCWKFIPWDSTNPSWLPERWKVIEESNTPISTEKYCKDNDHRYAWVLIWDVYISDERAWAEFLATRGIIEKRNLAPSLYNLEWNITRKEIMKIISKIWKINAEKAQCEFIFKDVINDWGCKYIETALKNEFIADNITFRPEENVTKVEAIKLILKAQGIKKRYTTQFWQEDYISTAYYLWFIDEKFSYYNEVASRAWIFSLAAKTYPEFSN